MTEHPVFFFCLAEPERFSNGRCEIIMTVIKRSVTEYTYASSHVETHALERVRAE